MDYFRNKKEINLNSIPSNTKNIDKLLKTFRKNFIQEMKSLHWDDFVLVNNLKSVLDFYALFIGREVFTEIRNHYFWRFKRQKFVTTKKPVKIDVFSS